MSAEKFERIVEMHGAFDKRHPDPNKNYGIHGMEIRFVLKGPLGAVQFLVFTGMHLPLVAAELWDRQGSYNPFEPMGADIGFHSPTPHYDSHTPIEDCPYLDGKPCYYDGSGLQAEEFMGQFLAGGSDAVWPMLEQRYRTWLEKSEEAVA
jgi:hypothetical protein